MFGGPAPLPVQACREMVVNRPKAASRARTPTNPDEAPRPLPHFCSGVRSLTPTLRSPFIEVHLSNPHAREPFRHTSYFTDLAVGIVAGLGPQGYGLALAAAIRRFDTPSP